MLKKTPEESDLIHYIFGKYLQKHSSVSDVIKMIENFKPIVVSDEDLSMSTEDKYYKISEYRVNTIFNNAVKSFDIKDISRIYNKQINFLKEFYFRIGKIMFSIKPPGLPFYADSNFLMSEFYNRIVVKDYVIVENLQLNLNNFYSMRVPRKDITDYYKKHTAIINYEPKLEKLIIEATNMKCFYDILDNCKSIRNQILDNINREIINEIYKIFDILEKLEERKQFKIESLNLQKKFSDILNKKFFYPTIEESVSGEFGLLKLKLTKWCIKIHNLGLRLDIFGKLKEMIMCILHSENVIRESLELENKFINIYEIDSITYEERQNKIIKENEEKNTY